MGSRQPGSRALSLVFILSLILMLCVGTMPISTVSAALTCAIPPTGLAAWWTGDGTTADRVNGNDGALVDGASYAAGFIDQAFVLDGSDDHIAIPDSPTLSVGSMTLDAWVFPDTIGNYQAIASQYYFDDRSGLVVDDSWLLYMEPGGYLSFYVYGPSSASHRGVITTDPVLIAGTWQFVAATFDLQSQDMFIYVNGVPVATVPQPGSTTLSSVNDSNAPLLIGANYTRGLELFWDGALDEVELTPRALTESELNTIYQAGSVGKCKHLGIQIDIKPGSYPNSINLGSNGVVAVALLSSISFDATTTDPLSITLADAQVRLKGNGTPMASSQDVNYDGLQDLVVHVSTSALQLSYSDTAAVLQGYTYGGQLIQGSDTVRIVP